MQRRRQDIKRVQKLQRPKSKGKNQVRLPANAKRKQEGLEMVKDKKDVEVKQEAPVEKKTGKFGGDTPAPKFQGGVEKPPMKK